MPREHQDRAGAREPGLAAAQGAVLCSGHDGFAPRPAGGVAEGRGEWVPSPGRAPRGEGEVPAPARQHRWVAAGAGGSSARQGRSLCPLGRLPLWPVAVCGCRRGPGGSRGSAPHVWGGRSGRCRGPAQTPPALVRCWPQPRGLLVVALCHRCCCCVGLNPPRFSQTLALARSPGEKGDVAGLPSPSLPPLPSRVHGTGEPLPKAPGRAARAREAAGFAGAAAARGLCGHSLTVPRLSLCRDGRTDGRRTPATPGAAEPPGRSRAACAQADAAACPAPGWGQPCLARPVTPRLQLSCLGPRLFWVPFQLPVPSVWSCGLLSVAAPARGRLQFRLQAQLSFGSCSSSWTAPAHFHARLRMVPARVWLQLPLLATSSWSAAPARAC